MKSKITLIAAIGLILAGSAHASTNSCRGKLSKGNVYVYEIKFRGGPGGLQSSELSVHSVRLCDNGGKIEYLNKTPLSSGTFGFFCDSDKTTDADLWTVDLKKEKILPPAFLGFAFKRCQKDGEAKLQASWIPYNGAPPHPAHEIAYERDGDINESYQKIWSTFALAKPDDDQLKEYLASYDKHSKQQAAAGSGWIAGFWSKCYQEQIAAVQEGRGIGQSWFPKVGTTFVADDGFFTITNVISENPLRLLVEGPAQADSAVANRCYAILKLKDKSQLEVTQAPAPGYTLFRSDQIHGFSVKTLGKATVKIKTLRSIASEEKMLPEFEILGKIPMAQRP